MQNPRLLIALNENTRSVLRNWRRSIAGLVRLAVKNLETAKELATEKNYCEAVSVAATSVENIARAFLHCYGGRPNLNSGQEEALRMISARLCDERTKFELAIQNVAYINTVKDVLRTSTINKKEAKKVVTIASNIIEQFSRNMFENFSKEIPELLSIVKNLNTTRAPQLPKSFKNPFFHGN